MVCPDCATKYDNDKAVCPGCGEQNEAIKPMPAPAPRPPVGRIPR